MVNMKRRETEKWHIRKCWTIILGTAFLWPLTTFFIALFNQHRDVTFTNLAVGLLAINMVFCLCYYIGLRAIWNLYPKIPLNNKDILKNVTLTLIDCLYVSLAPPTLV